jgi:gluconate 2-dehydrogenase gamma chain
MSEPVSRRRFVQTTGLIGASAVLVPPALAEQPGVDMPPGLPPPPGRHPFAFHEQPTAPVRFFLIEPEAAFLTAAVDRLIPPDERWPGAAEAGVVDYIDRQLAGAYGHGARMYLDGPWHQGTPQQGYQLPFAPAQLYRIAIRALGTHVEETFGRGFDQLEGEEQDRVLGELETGAVDLGDVPSPVFFETLLANTIEGYFSDPAYGGNRGMVGWRMVGFPGAFGQFFHLVEHHGMTYDYPPMGMAESLVHHQHHHD